MTLEIIKNDGRFGPCRMAWLLVCDGELVAHCGLRYRLAEDIEKVRASLRETIFRLAMQEDTA